LIPIDDQSFPARFVKGFAGIAAHRTGRRAFATTVAFEMGHISASYFDE
jgi:hypothetical protein